MTSLIATTGTCLTRVAWVYACDLNPSGFCFISNKAKELGKRPGVHTSLPLTFVVNHTLTDISQVLKYDGRAWGSMLNNPFAQHMVMVFTLPKQLTRKFLQVPFGRFCSLGLQLATETKYTPFLFFPLSISKELAGSGHSRTVQAQVYPDHLTAWRYMRLRDGYDDMQAVASLAVAQISTTRLANKIGERVLGDAKPYLSTTCYRPKTTVHHLPLYPSATAII